MATIRYILCGLLVAMFFTGRLTGTQQLLDAIAALCAGCLMAYALTMRGVVRKYEKRNAPAKEEATAGEDDLRTQIRAIMLEAAKMAGYDNDILGKYDLRYDQNNLSVEWKYQGIWLHVTNSYSSRTANELLKLATVVREGLLKKISDDRAKIDVKLAATAQEMASFVPGKKKSNDLLVPSQSPQVPLGAQTGE